eukprot:TRINITY_DN10888_c0_g1_i2.p1 TRINITY_DN10888_c0_g1~~TRINITY_DN10888_c0_g1_i2.p1  ORF type:complete len:453 (+),score=55.04 TRINITY_DN10888_c0_g1_i2:356-1714(+)
MRQVGTFLGEDFSLSKILRLEFINGADLRYYGIIYSLQKVFLGMQVPTDLQKVNRLAEGVAEIWWRQHCRQGPACTDIDERITLDSEPRGYALKALVPDFEVFRQLVFSAILLHRSFHDSPSDEEHVSLEDYIRLHRVLTDNGITTAESLENLLTQLYSTLKVLKISNLLADPVPAPEKRQGSLARTKCALAERSEVEGWARLGHGATRPHPLGRTSEAQFWQVFSEATASSRRGVTVRQAFQPTAAISPLSPALGVGCSSRLARDSAAAQGSGEYVWLSLCDTLLFLSTGPDDGAPIAFCHLENVQFAGIEPSHSRIAIQSGPPPFGEETAPPPLKLVFLLPDGRWRPIELMQLELEMSERGQLEPWINALARLALTGPSCISDRFHDESPVVDLGINRGPRCLDGGMHLRGRKSAPPEIPEVEDVPLDFMGITHGNMPPEPGRPECEAVD